MGSLKPGATYIYERDGGVIYSRELGSKERKVIGWDSGSDPDVEYQKLKNESILWRDVLTTAKTNPSLQKALDRAILIYQIIKEKQDGI